MEENNRIQNDEGHSGVIENTADTRINELQDEINLLKSQMEKLAPAFNLSKKMNAEKATDSIDFIADKINVMFIETMREDSVSKISFDQYKYSIENKFRQIQDGITSKIDTQKDSIDTRVGNMEDNQSNIEDSLMKIRNSVDKKVSQTDFEVYQFNSSKAHATKEEVAKLKAYLKLYVKTDDFGATQNSIDALKESMHNDYFVKSDVSQMLESVKEEMLSKTHQKQSYFENTVFEKFENQQSYIKENASNIGKVNVELKKIHKMIGKIRKELLEKATFSDIEKVYQEMDKYCMYQHLEDLEAQVTPQIQTFSESVHQFGEKIIQIENIVQRFDEILLTKASKVTMESLKDTLRKEFD
ncbi:unnamed protein product [Moneuplotes crassus]|uniref:Uncharacterized protein n=1 Tax=Euplotes crassus TaxID=5936 RepID=A0AAD1Y4H6_EUPCR|nr:unnamed protein product [Moneuplotes crassus]